MSKHYNSETEVRIHNVKIGIKDFLVEVLNKDNDEVNTEISSWSLPELKKQRKFFVLRFKNEFVDFYNKKYNGMLPTAEDILYKTITRK